MPRLMSILRQPLKSGGYIETGEGNKAFANISYGAKSESDLREIAEACWDAADQLDSQRTNNSAPESEMGAKT